MYQKYSIGTMAKLMGISAEAIRYYESRNIISPVRDPETGYRYYNTWDFHMLLRARHYQNYGFSRSGKYLSLESLQEGFRYLKQNGLSLAGDIVTQVACMTKPEEEYFNWHIVWFPIEK